MSLERTVENFVKEIEHVTGVRIRIRWMPFCGLYLEDVETGSTYALGAIYEKLCYLLKNRRASAAALTAST